MSWPDFQRLRRERAEAKAARHAKHAATAAPETEPPAPPVVPDPPAQAGVYDQIVSRPASASAVTPPVVPSTARKPSASRAPAPAPEVSAEDAPDTGGNS